MKNCIFYESLLPEEQNGFYRDKFAFFKVMSISVELGGKFCPGIARGELMIFSDEGVPL